ncbi:MAG: hypothetical protein B6244_03010 [Candidatus Cloacimonetes bacterium 4572_55]|nr:MAG: hypothetical protein B6244_03010 [Candidatus Cloacimonetes bacterium 4572_55]
MLTPPKGYSIKDLQRQQYDWRTDKRKVVDDFQVNEDPTRKSNQWSPAVAADEKGNSIVVWEDWRNDNRDIYAQILDVNGKKIDANFIINDDRNEASQKNADVIATKDGSYLIIWRDDRNGNNDIYAQKITATGQPIGQNFRVHESNSAEQINPSVAQSSDGSFFVVWEDWRNGNIDIFGCKLPPNGKLAGHSSKINSDFSGKDQTSPKVAFDAIGRGIVTWRDFRHQKSVYDGADIYAQRIGKTSAPVGENFMVNENDNGKFDQCNPNLSVSDHGEVFIVWRDNRNGNLDIHGQIYHANGVKSGVNILINDDDSKRAQRHPSVCINGRGEFMVVWADRRSENFDIYGQCFTVDGQRIEKNFRINDGFGSPAIQSEPVVACDLSGNLLLSWIDYRYMSKDQKTDVFAQRGYFDNLLDLGENKKPATPATNLTTRQSN